MIHYIINYNLIDYSNANPSVTR